VLNDLKRALGRVQSDYGFYIECQANPAVALAGYDLSADERSVLTDPVKLADVLRGGIGASPLRITISGTHDWVNRTRPKKKKKKTTNVQAIAHEAEAVKQASTHEERTGAAVRLMRLIG
jgi:hypothetical protein